MKKPKDDKHNAHNFIGRVCHWRYCKKCGLVELKNESTQQRIKKGCEE